MRQKRRTVTGWVLPPTRDITLRDIIQMSERIGGRMYLRYHLTRREFVAYTTADETAQQKLAVLLGHFPKQNVNV